MLSTHQNDVTPMQDIWPMLRDGGGGNGHLWAFSRLRYRTGGYSTLLRYSISDIESSY